MVAGVVVLAILLGLVHPGLGIGVLLIAIFNCLDDIRARLQQVFPTEREKTLKTEDAEAKAAREERERIAEEQRQAKKEEAVKPKPGELKRVCARCRSELVAGAARCGVCQHINAREPNP